jgi:hypothetical protein
MFFEPIVLDNIFDDKDIKKLKKLVHDNKKDFAFDGNAHRFDFQHEEIEGYFSKKLEPLAKKLFNDETLKTTYSHYSMYNHPLSNLIKHKDMNACTYTIDLCLSADTPWGIWIEEREYVLQPGQAIAFMGEDQEHWRGPFPDPYDNCVEMIFFHFAKPDHWWFTKGKEYKQVKYEIAKENNDELLLGYDSKTFDVWLKEIEK